MNFRCNIKYSFIIVSILRIDCCVSPALYPFYPSENERIVIVVDVFRASSSICSALAAGAVAVRPVKSLEEAERAKQQGELVGAERDTIKCDFADFGNSPSDYKPEILNGKTVFFTSTNGTRAIELASTDSTEVLVGAFVNLSAVANYCISSKKDILVLCSGWRNKFNKEDTLFAGALAEILTEKENFTANSDAIKVAMEMWHTAKPNILAYLSDSEHIARLLKWNLQRDIDFCLTIDRLNILPKYEFKTRILKNFC
jgi:2-phosphosulfolactate phosphatase